MITRTESSDGGIVIHVTGAFDLEAGQRLGGLLAQTGSDSHVVRAPRRDGRSVGVGERSPTFSNVHSCSSLHHPSSADVGGLPCNGTASGRRAARAALPPRKRPIIWLWIHTSSQRPPSAPPREGWKPMAPYDAASFAAGQNCGARIASCVARLAASELMRGAHWWNRWRRGAMSSALIAYAEEVENDADAGPAARRPAS